MKRIQIWLKETSEPLDYVEVINTYQKGDIFVIQFIIDSKITYDKYPLGNIWRVREYEARKYPVNEK